MKILDSLMGTGFLTAILSILLIKAMGSFEKDTNANIPQWIKNTLITTFITSVVLMIVCLYIRIWS